MQLSRDGEWFWDGTEWRATYSPDRHWRWDGRSWVPTWPQPPQQWRFEPTEWTGRLQVIVLALMAVGILVGIVTFPTILLPAMQQSMDRSIAIQSANSNVDPEQLRSFTNSIIYVTLGFTVVLTAVTATIIVIGTVRLWRWVYWLLVAGYLLALLSIPQNVLYALGLGTITLTLPAWWSVLGIFIALAEGALGIWMIILYRRFGTWARRRVPG